MPNGKLSILDITQAFLREIPEAPQGASSLLQAELPILAHIPPGKPVLKHPIGTGADRRRRWRAKTTGRVHIRGSIGAIDSFEDVAKTVDVNRHGLLVNTSRSGYWVGQSLQVTFPYWTAPTAINVPRAGTVVRDVPLQGYRYAVAAQFDPPVVKGAKANGSPSSDVRDETPRAVVAEAEGCAGDGGPTGRELCTLIRRTHRLQHVPVILLTNSALPSDYSAGRRAGAMLCVPMPLRPAAAPTRRTSGGAATGALLGLQRDVQRRGVYADVVSDGRQRHEEGRGVLRLARRLAPTVAPFLCGVGGGESHGPKTTRLTTRLGMTTSRAGVRKKKAPREQRPSSDCLRMID